MALSTYGEQGVLKHVLGVAAYPFPTTVYMALFTTNPVMPAGTGGVEVSGGNYARQPITWSVTGSGPAMATNNALVQFPTATANWGTIVGGGIYDAPTGGNLVEASPLTVQKLIGLGDVFAVPIGNYTNKQT
ncbi:phage tail fiber protein [Paraburkholderia caribensis]|uniref:phage tail fiber protein n=1 Tax=Paraburkholderia caribensis TaxID=75105 RepID=UPI00078D8F0B|nr:hypothetical protein [Paraburkholderia caribensis]AMV42262.1 hypothetical protein ATN79_06165 [Paraburkholderia caribensis]